MSAMHSRPHYSLFELNSLAGVFLEGLVTWSGAFADGDAEREALARLVHELEALAPIISVAEA
jgi:hypothetical protein